jgi:lysophospholipase L1-like esterase
MARALALCFCLICSTLFAADEAWVAAMKAVHAKGGSQKGSVSQIGDSITYTKAFLAGLAWGELKGAEWDALKRLNGKHFNDRKGAEHANYSGWTAADGLAKVPGVLAAQKPEIAVIMYGTNDTRKNVPPAEYEKNLKAIVEHCLKAGCVPIISTIPPQLTGNEKVEAINAVIKKIAAEQKVPLIDFYAEILKRQPGTAWDGTILGKGDVHPTGGANFDFSEANLKVCGYALRNYLVCKAMKDVIEKCF